MRTDSVRNLSVKADPNPARKTRKRVFTLKQSSEHNACMLRRCMMEKFAKLFGADGPVMNFLTKVTDLMILNILTLLLCLPIVTGGAALTALYYVTGRMIRGESYAAFKTYFSSFKRNFKQATCEWLMVLALAALLFVDISVLIYNNTRFPRIFIYLLIAIAIVLFILLQFLFPLQSRFENPVKKTVHNTFILAIANFPRAILLAVCWTLPVLLVMTSLRVIPFLFLFGLSVPAYLKAQIFVPVFKNFEPEEEEVEKDDYAFEVDVDNPAFDAFTKHDEEKEDSNDE